MMAMMSVVAVMTMMTTIAMIAMMAMMALMAMMAMLVGQSEMLQRGRAMLVEMAAGQSYPCLLLYTCYISAATSLSYNIQLLHLNTAVH